MLSERQLEILLALVYEYIQTGEPVGSRTLARKYLKGHSAATIRNEMADMEELGYFSQPHSSAGRLPMSQAYRVYVDSILHRPTEALPGVDDVVRQMDLQVKRLSERLDDISRFLGRLTSCLGVAAVKVLDSLKLQKIDFVRVSSHSMLMVLILEGGTVQHSQIPVDPQVSDEALAEMISSVNRIAAGCPWGDVRHILERYAAQAKEFGQPMLDRALQGMDRLMHRERLAFSAGGVSQLCGGADGENLSQLHAILGLLEEEQTMEELIEDHALQNGISVTIGTENPRSSMKNCSVVMASSSNEGRQAVIGLIGPLRMNYQRSIAVLDAVLAGLKEEQIEWEV